MKYSTCITNPAIVTSPLDKILATVVDAGFDGVDIPMDAELFPLKKIQEAYASVVNKIKIPEITACMNPTRDLIHPDAKLRNQAVAYIKSCIDLAVDLGVKLTHFCFLSYPDNLEKTPRKKLEDRAVGVIKDLSGYASTHGVRLLVEPLFKGDVSLVNRCDQGADLYARALGLSTEEFIKGTKQTGLLLDIFHMHHEETDIVASLKRYLPIAHHIHVADHPRGLDFSRKDSVFVSTAMKIIKESSYQGYISFESFDPAFGLAGLKNALKSLKSCVK